MIVSSAYLYEDKIYIGARHHIILQANRGVKLMKGISGFIDETGKFYNRQEAKAHVIEIDQWHKQTSSNPLDLYSEDVW